MDFEYRVIWSDDDQQYIGLYAHLPALSWLDPDPEEALRGIKKLVEAIYSEPSETW